MQRPHIIRQRPKDPQPRHVRFPVTFAFRLTQEDADRLRDIADAHDTTPGEWAREIVSRAAGFDYQRRTVKLHIQNRDLLRHLLGELGRQGSNLNQISRRLNEVPGRIPDGTEAAIAVQQADNKKLMNAIHAILRTGQKP